jgi:ferredoxin-NADP reductase
VWASSAPCADGTVSVTVHRLHDDPAGDWLLDRVQEGDVLPIGAAVGDFALPNEAPARVLFVAQGAGLIPVFSLLLSLAYSEQLRDVVIVTTVRTPEALLFAERLRALGHAFRGIALHVLPDPTLGDGDATSLLQAIELRVPDAAQRCTWVAGSEALGAAFAEPRRRAHATGTLRVAHVVP